MKNVFITGGTGYIGSRLIKALVKQGGYSIKALVRKGSEHKLPDGCEAVPGDALDAESYWKLVPANSIFIHLVGVAHPSPSKKEQFRAIDLVSIREAVKAATEARVRHFVYLSVSQFRTRIMEDYQQVRAEGEKLVISMNIPASFVRPWYVLGPGHWWPVALWPFYRIASIIPSFREQALQLGLVTIGQMIETLCFTISHPPASGVDIYNVPDIKNISAITINLRPVL